MVVYFPALKEMIQAFIGRFRCSRCRSNLRTWRKYLKGPAAQINSASHLTVRAVSLLLRPSTPTSRCGRDPISVVMTSRARWCNRMRGKKRKQKNTAYHRVRSTDNRGCREWSGCRVTPMHQTAVRNSISYVSHHKCTRPPNPHPAIPANMLRALTCFSIPRHVGISTINLRPSPHKASYYSRSFVPFHCHC